MSRRPCALLVGLLALLTSCSGAGADAPAAPAGTRPTTAPSTTTSSTTGPAAAHASPTQEAQGHRACAEQTLESLDLEARAGQTLMIGLDAGQLGSDVSWVRRQEVGGVFLSGASGRSVESLRRGTRSLQRTASVPLLVSTDQEGGKVQRLKGEGFPRLVSATEQGSWSTTRLTAQWRAEAGAMARAGVRMNLAPVADVVPASAKRTNPPIGKQDREYGATAAAAGPAVAAVVRAQEQEGVVSTLKHFPGLGRVAVNTDLGAGATDAETGPDSDSLLAFARGWEAGAPAVMMSSATYPKLDPDQEALFSRKIVTGLLRERLGFRGLVMTDDVGRAEALADVPLGRRATRFLAAGGDLVLSVRPQDAGPMHRAVVAEARRDASFRRQVDAAALRVLTVKADAGLLTC